MDVWECALGFMNSQILIAAEEIGVFQALSEGGGTLDDIVRSTGLPEASAERLLTALCALELIEKEADGSFVNTPDAQEKLVPGSPRYIGGMFQHLAEDLYPLWEHFDEALFEEKAQWEKLPTGTQPRNEEIYEDPGALQSFHEGMFGISYEPARELAEQMPKLNEIRYVVDVGGASGAFLIALAERFDNLHGTVFDLPQLEPIAEEFFRRYGVSERLTFVGGDFWNDHLPQGADVYSLGFVLHDWDRTGGSALLRKVADAMDPGATLIVGEYLLNDDRTGPVHVARQDLNMLVAAKGRERTAGEYEAWISRFGFQLERIVHSSHGKHFLIATFVPEARRDADAVNGRMAKGSHRREPVQ